MAQHAFEEMQWIAHEIGPLISLDPDLVEDIYRAAFSHKETSDAPTSISGSKILALTSNRRQDFEGALYELATAYPRFLREAPLHATRALISAYEVYISVEHASAGDDATEQSFDFEDRQAAIRADYSSIWDSGIHVTHDAVTLLNEFESYLRELSQNADEAGTRRQVLDVLVARSRLAGIWRRLLIVGSAHPQSLGTEIRCLAWGKPILTSFDTRVAAGDFLRAIFSLLPVADRARIESAILSIPSSVEEKHQKIADADVDRLLGCLSPESVVTEQAVRRLATIARQGGHPPNEPLVQISPVSMTPYSETQYLADQGVPVEAECNRRVEELSRPVRQFVSSHLNSTPTAEEAEAILASLRELHEGLQTAKNDGVHPEQENQAWGHLAGACETIARIEALSCVEGVGALAKGILLEASSHPIPLPKPELNSQFDEHPSWGGPSARISAAAGLALMAHDPNCAGQSVLAAVERLSADPVPAVRFQVATRLPLLYHTAPEVMWRILDNMCREDESRGVLSGLVGASLARLAGHHPHRIAESAELVFNRVKSGPGAERVRQACVNIFTGLYLWQDNRKCKEIVFRIAENPQACVEEAQQLLAPLREAMVVGPVHPPAPDKDDVRKRAIALMLHVLESVRAKMTALENSLREASPANFSDAMKEEAQHLFRLANSACHEVYFASGAFDHKSAGRGALHPKVGAPEKRRFFTELKPALNILGSLGFPAVVHNLLETLEFLLEVDPRGVFLLIANVVRSGKAGGYQYEPMAADLIVRFVERYLAEYRHILRQDRECREALREILDTFVQWPNARRLTYRLDEIFR
jgi:hypothetical protein